ncbi:MAG: ABC transporter permease [Chloroflexi bacterium]|nr:ABC transporter permease [Chloroflexota bacterium]
MRLIEFMAIALRSLLANKLRSSLTMLGIVIGVGAVISLMSVGQGAQARITSTFEQLGTNVLYVMPSSPEVGGLGALMTSAITPPSLTLADGQALERVSSIVAVAPTNENIAELTYGGEKTLAVIHGSTPDYIIVSDHELESGQFITDQNVASRDMVIVLGNQIARNLFGSNNPVGQKIKMKGNRLTVIGVLKAKGGAIMGMSLDSISLIPITTFQSRLSTQRTASGEDAVQSISVKVASAEAIDRVKEEASTLLRRRHRLADDEKNDFSIVSQAQVLGIFGQITGIFTVVLGAIAGISLLVGAIGIMNIMLVSVTERTREIGIRKAVGAKHGDILLQFLLEAAMLSLTGGGIGIVGGWLLAVLISRIDIGGFSLRPVVSADIIILAVSVSVFIGLASGIYPAMRAARLNPIDALRYG